MSDSNKYLNLILEFLNLNEIKSFLSVKKLRENKYNKYYIYLILIINELSISKRNKKLISLKIIY